MIRSRPPHPALLAWLLLMATAVAAMAATPWKTAPERSSLSFVGTQAGAPFEGVFHAFTADIRFDPYALAESRFEVVIDMGSVDSRDREPDDIIRSPELFAAEHWPAARYVVEQFVPNVDGTFRGAGKLTIRDVPRDVPGTARLAIPWPGIVAVTPARCSRSDTTFRCSASVRNVPSYVTLPLPNALRVSAGYLPKNGWS